MNSLTVSPITLSITFLLVLIGIFISYKEKLGLEKDIIITVLRAIVQLTVVGYVLSYIFGLNKGWATLAMIAVIVFNAAWNAGQRGKGINKSFQYSLVAIALATAVTLCVLVFSGSIQFIPSQMVPITGMIAGNAMNAIGLAYRNLNQLFTDRHQSVVEMLALGAKPKTASSDILRLSIQGGMQPTIDSVKTVGLVSLPGMMSGLMFAGVDPAKAILYQIMVSFMLISTTGLASFTATYLAYREFFNDRYQLLTKETH